jgi:replicative DNA helicase
MRETFKRITRRRRAAPHHGIPTGFDRYDRLTSGLHDGELTIVAARPGMGKTSFVLNMAANVASPQAARERARSERALGGAGHGVVVFSLEMPREQIVNRMLCSEARVDVGKVRTGMLSPSDWSKLTQAAGRLAPQPDLDRRLAALSLLELRSKVRRLRPSSTGTTRTGEPRSKAHRPRRRRLPAADEGAGKGRSSREQEISEISRG